MVDDLYAPGKQGTLYVTATPIGNLEDITLRALRILKGVALIVAEDTRRTRKLLSHYQISTNLMSCFGDREEERIPTVLDILERGGDVALVTDAGTPGISDPGYRLVRQARIAGLPVESVPGASAVTAALSISGVGASRFTFHGFPSRQGIRRRELLDAAAAAEIPQVFFEAPGRTQRLLQDLAAIAPRRPAMVIREISKVHEEYTTALLEELAVAFNEAQEKGEIVVILDSQKTATPNEAETMPPPEFFALVKKYHIGAKAAAAIAACLTAASSRAVYQKLLADQNMEEKE